MLFAWIGLSLKTQALYLLVFVTRYLQFSWVSTYNTLMKVFFIVSSCYIIYLIVVQFRYVQSFSISKAQLIRITQTNG